MNSNSISKHFAHWKGQFTKYTKSKFFREGVPFILLVVIGSFGLKELCEVRYTIKKVDTIKIEIDEEEERRRQDHEKKLMDVSKVDIFNWENKRIPRESDKEKMKNQS